MIYKSWVSEIILVEQEACVVPFPGNEANTTRPNYRYTLAIESTPAEDHPSLIVEGSIVVRSAEKLNWRLGQNIHLDIQPLEAEFEKAAETT